MAVDVFWDVTLCSDILRDTWCSVIRVPKQWRQQVPLKHIYHTTWHYILTET